MYKIAVWKMIQEAINAMNQDEVSAADIRKYIFDHYGDVNSNTISTQINACCVNQQGRASMPENHKPRIANGKYDFLYSVGRGIVTRYDQKTHGVWEIAEQDGKLVVRQTDRDYPLPAAAESNVTQNPQPTRQARKTKTADIKSPTREDVQRYIESWKKLENYIAQEKALNKLFWEFCPENKELDDILLKAAALNAFYATNIYNVFAVAKHIMSLDIDDRLKQGDESLVTDIASGHGVKYKKTGKELHFYSFATKYCSHHRPDVYPIFDSYVEKLLIHLRNTDEFADFLTQDLRNISVLKKIILKLQEFYALESFTLKEIDQYLWQYGKEMFPNVY